MPAQVLIIDPPHELKFKVELSGLFEQGYTTHMKLTNPTNDTVLFKIKTTAPKKYCVRPNLGTLEPKSSIDIAITPQSVLVEPNEKHKHKFMVQSVIAPEGKTNIDQVWKEISPEQLMDHKLKCVFDAPRGSVLNDSGDVAQTDAGKKRVALVEDKPPIAKSASAAKHEPIDTELHKPASEVIQVREEEESVLRYENIQLKEELLRLRQSVAAATANVDKFGPEKGSPAMMMMGTAFLMALIGIIIGKCFM